MELCCGELSMYSFDIYLYEGFSGCGEVDEKLNPRRLLRPEGAEKLLSAVAERHPGDIRTAGARQLCGKAVDDLLLAGALTERDGSLLFGCPVFLPQDLHELERLSSAAAQDIASALLRRSGELRAAARKYFPDMEPGRALYHLLCCGVFDGTFIEQLEQRGLVSCGTLRPCGLSYVPVLYARCAELDALSRRLLCSRQACGGEAGEFVSFGDLDGVRRDFAAARRSGELSAERAASLAADFAALCRGEGAPESSLEAFERFGYTENGRRCVPVFPVAERRCAVDGLTDIVLREALPAAERALEALPGAELTANRHGVEHSETANELFHLIFGAVNWLLCSAGLAAMPAHAPGEGRYFRSFEPRQEKGEDR